MLRELAIKEFLIQVLDRKYAVYFLFSSVLLITSFYYHLDDYQAKYQNHTALEHTFRQSALQDSSYWRLLYNGIKVSCRPPALQALCRGTESVFSKFANIAVSIRSKEPYPFIRTEKYLNPAPRFFPAMDFPLIVSFVLSLMVFIFTHDAVSREREEGTLKLLLSYPVSRAQIIVTKFASRYAVLVLPLVFSFLVFLLLAGLSPLYRLTGGELAAVGMILALTLLYFLVLVFLGIFISTCCRRSATSIALLLLVWIIFIIVLHNAAILFLEKRVQAKAVAQVLDFQAQQKKDQEIREKMQAVVQEKLGTNQAGRRGFNWRSVPREQIIEINFMQLGVVEQFLTQTVEQYINNLDNHFRLLARLGFISPSLLFITSATELADTGVKSHIRLLSSILEYQRYFKTAGQAKIKGQLAKQKSIDEPVDRAYKEFRSFKTEPTPLGVRLADVSWYFFALCCYAVLFFLLAFLAFIKIDIS